MITPTIGRKLWYYPKGEAQRAAGEQPFDATVVYVNSDGTVNLAINDWGGKASQVLNATLLQEGETPPVNNYHFACWMPYQVGQAKKEEETKVEKLEPEYKSYAEEVSKAARKGFHGK